MVRRCRCWSPSSLKRLSIFFLAVKLWEWESEILLSQHFLYLHHFWFFFRYCFCNVLAVTILYFLFPCPHSPPLLHYYKFSSELSESASCQPMYRNAERNSEFHLLCIYWMDGAQMFIAPPTLSYAYAFWLRCWLITSSRDNFVFSPM